MSVKLSEQLCSAVLPTKPSDWAAFRREELLLEISYPSSWRIDELKHSVILCPAQSRCIPEDGNVIFSPALNFFGGEIPNCADDAALDSWWSQMRSGSIPGFMIHEADKMTLNGMRTLAVCFDYQRASGKYRCLVTLRARGNVTYHFDATGHPDDIESFRPLLVQVLANLRFYSSAAEFHAAQSTYSRPLIHDTQPEGTSVGVLFEIAKCNESAYGRAFERQFFARLDARLLAGARIFVGDILPECRYYCIRVEGTHAMIRYVRDVFTQVNDIDALPQGANRLMSGYILRNAPLISKAFTIDQATGRFI